MLELQHVIPLNDSTNHVAHHEKNCFFLLSHFFIVDRLLGWTGFLSALYCGLKINRDISASINILLKFIHDNISQP